MLINLKEIVFPNRLSITTKTEVLLNDESDAYLLSMPLMISAQLGNDDLYQKARTKMMQAMMVVEQSPFKAWLYGRLLFAAHTMRDEKTVLQIQKELNILLDKITDHFNAYVAWALGYIAALNETEYKKVKSQMLEIAEYLTTKKDEPQSNVLWVWVMLTQAAANANDHKLYQYSLHKISMITGQECIADALHEGIPINDFRAWALSIMQAAAQRINDEASYVGLKEQSIKAIGEAERIQDVLLAQVNTELASMRDECKKQEECRQVINKK